MSAIFLLRLDLRIKDNLGLIECFKNPDVKKIYLVFNFDPKQIDRDKNPYFSNNCVQFMIESLEELYQKTDKKLMFTYGDYQDTIPELLKVLKVLEVKYLYVNQDYTPYSKERDSIIEKICLDNNCEFHSCHDLMLTPIDFPVKPDESHYKQYSSYLNKASTKKVKDLDYLDVSSKLALPPKTFNKKLKFKIPIKKLKSFYNHNPDINVNGGRILAKKILKNISQQKDYDKLRGLCDYKSSHLSAYIKFGCVSIREVYHSFVNALGVSNGLVKQLYWREFYYYIIYHFPETYTKKIGLKPAYQNFPWSQDKNKLEAWSKGETGYPIVDASMRHLNKTGYMPNRSRLIVANFLTKLLRIDWTLGEKYFATKLVDYSPSNNLGNWQWVASIGADYQNRIYNPMSQSLKSDPDCDYIKKWIPSLSNINNKHLHNWNKHYQNYNLADIDYLAPIINYKEEYDLSKKMFKEHI